jgi:hypothetical protein
VVSRQNAGLQKGVFLMKNKKILLVIPAIALVFAMAVIGCGSSGASSIGEKPTSVTYISADSAGNTYELEISSASARAAYNPKQGDNYVLTINPGNKKSSGTVKSFTGGEFTLAKGNDEFKVAITNGEMTEIKGTIPCDDGSKKEAPAGRLTPVNNELPHAGDGSLGETVNITDQSVIDAPSGTVEFDEYFKENIIGSEVKTVNGKLTFKLTSNIKQEFLAQETQSLDEYNGRLVTKTPSDLQIIMVDAVALDSNIDDYYGLRWGYDIERSNSDEENYVLFLYADKDGTISGKSRDGTYTCNLVLKKGWNTVLRRTVDTYSFVTDTYVTGKPDSNYKWFLKHLPQPVLPGGGGGDNGG